MDIEQFYDADPRRRASDEEQFGREWTDDDGIRWEINWVAETGEVYAMREVVEPGAMDPVGDTWVQELPTELVTVEILGLVQDRHVLAAALDGWDQQMLAAGSLGWVRGQVVAVAGPGR